MAQPPKPGEYDPTEHLREPTAPRVLHYPENQADVQAYADAATVEAVVLIDRVFFNQGKGWGFYEETVKLSSADAAVLSKAKHVAIVSKR